MTRNNQSPSPDDVMIWPDGCTALRSEIEAGYFNHKSDDFLLATEAEMNENGYYTEDQVEALNQETNHDRQ